MTLQAISPLLAIKILPNVGSDLSIGQAVYISSHFLFETGAAFRTKLEVLYPCCEMMVCHFELAEIFGQT